MNLQAEFIQAVKNLELAKSKIIDYTRTVIFCLTVYILEYDTGKIKKRFENAFKKNEGLTIIDDLKEFEKYRPFLGNEIWHLFDQFLVIHMRIYSKTEIDFKRGEIKHWTYDDQLVNIIDAKYHPILFAKEDFNKVGGGPLYEVIKLIETEMVEKINERLREFNPDNNYNFSDVIIGDYNIKGNENVLKNTNSFSFTIKLFAKEHPFLFWLQILIDLFAIYLVLVQLKWITL